jgi:uncharacterized protein (DUF1697 family)
METYISILRGINVGGQKKIQMTDLKLLYEGLELAEIITYIQSGNVIFKTDKNCNTKELADRIEQAIEAKYDFTVPVILRAVKEIENTLAVNPFLKENNIDFDKLHVTFLADKPSKENLGNLKNFDYSPDKFIIDGMEIFLYCPNGYGITKLSNNFFENKLKVRATTRNWKTVNKLFELAR